MDETWRTEAYCTKCCTIRLIKAVVSGTLTRAFGGAPEAKVAFAKVTFEGCGHRQEIAISERNLKALGVG